MKRAGVILVVFVGLVALGCGFAGTTMALNITRPADASSNVKVRFEVKDGDTATDVAERLAEQGLIRNAMVFKLYARYKRLDAGIQKGVYDLSPDMTMDQIITKLQTATPDEQIVTVPPGMRVTQYPAYFTDLPNFNADNFMTITKTGVLPDGTNLWDKYWYVKKPGKTVKYALEGYLFPDTYYFDRSATETDVVERLLNTLGEKLCPGPDSKPDQYILDKAQCRANGVKVGKDNTTNIFDAMDKAYSTKDDVQALYLTMTIASLTVREVLNLEDAPGVTNVYYTRYLALQGKTDNKGDVASMGADPTAQYALESKNPPKDGKWWAPLKDAAANVEPNDPYNAAVQTNKELPPGPIAAPLWEEIAAAANPSVSKYFYFANDKCGKTLYATTKDEFLKYDLSKCN